MMGGIKGICSLGSTLNNIPFNPPQAISEVVNFFHFCRSLDLFIAVTELWPFQVHNSFENITVAVASLPVINPYLCR